MISRSAGTSSKFRTTSGTVASSLNAGTTTESLGSYWIEEFIGYCEPVGGRS